MGPTRDDYYGNQQTLQGLVRRRNCDDIFVKYILLYNNIETVFTCVGTNKFDTNQSRWLLWCSSGYSWSGMVH